MMRGYGYGSTMNGYSPFGGFVFFCFGLLALVGIVLLIVWIVRMNSGHGHMMMGHGGPMGPHVPPAGMPMSATGHDEAMMIARKRLAAGEITNEQFEEIRKTLGG